MYLGYGSYGTCLGWLIVSPTISSPMFIFHMTLWKLSLVARSSKDSQQGGTIVKYGIFLFTITKLVHFDSLRCASLDNVIDDRFTTLDISWFILLIKDFVLGISVYGYFYYCYMFSE